ncbi:radical SAM domain-containing protein [Besnoitia besnoiti]|uniref:Radical SAM domain-containing protein n=1 Tax=Besnoitia besnoiti TaxID=94643 RepID=A0A2A9M8D1_BESBE|nr:radical SAM domain-containing protein [Besnoitia besnoiti]PFH31897.1 radical SAM domain-containing protein [Besnoitia besnoiti]
MGGAQRDGESGGARCRAVDLESSSLSLCSSSSPCAAPPLASCSSSAQEPRTSVFDRAALLSAVEGKEVHAHKIWRYVIQKGADFGEIPDLPKRVYATLEARFATSTSRLLEAKTSRDASTTKLLLELADGSRIETCIMRYGAVEYALFPEVEKKKREASRKGKTGPTLNHGADDAATEAEAHAPERPEGARNGDREDDSHRRPFKSNRRATVCISAQVGCQMGCTFCATGTMGKKRNLTEAEILEQLFHASRVEKIRNVVFMGMGEPLDNYNSVVSAVRFMTQPNKFAIGGHHVCISTVGLPQRIRQLAVDLPATRLALSLHAPDQPTRLKLMPRAAAGWKLESVLAATDEFVKQQKLVNSTAMKNIGLLVEYIMIQDLNDTPEQAHALGRILQPRADAIIVNLIPYNPTEVPYDYRPSAAERVDAFLKILRQEYSIKALVRQTLGQDIDSACGQLVVRTAPDDAREKKARARSGSQSSVGSEADAHEASKRVLRTSGGFPEGKAWRQWLWAWWHAVKERVSPSGCFQCGAGISGDRAGVGAPDGTEDAAEADGDEQKEARERREELVAASIALVAGVVAAGAVAWSLRRTRV